MNEYDVKPNSHASKAAKQAPTDEKKIKKVVTGQVRTRKKSEISKFTDIFISEDASNVKSYIINDMIVPTVKKIIVGSIDMLLNGGEATYTGRKSTSKVSYNKYYDDRRYDRRDDRPRARNRFDFDEIVFESRAEAEAVRRQMIDTIEEYGVVTVADMYDMAELTQPFTSNRYGWYDIRGAETQRLRDGGYVIKLPKIVPVD
jgi:hypothetical protein